MDQIWLNHYDAHVKHEFNIPNETICDLLKRAANENPTSIALIYDNSKITYAELYELTNRVGRNLNKWGYSHGDRIGIAFANTPQFVIS